MADQSLKLPATQTYSEIGGRCGIELSDASMGGVWEGTRRYTVSKSSPQATRLEGWMARRGGQFRPGLFTRRMGTLKWGRHGNGSEQTMELTVCAPAPQVKVARCCWVIIRGYFCQDADGRKEMQMAR